MCEDDYTPVTIVNYGASAYHSVYITGALVHSSKYVELYGLLRTADEDDTIEIIINSEGGLFSTGVQIIDMIKESKATVNTSIYGIAHSTASMLFLAGKKKHVAEHSTMACHYYNAEKYSKASDVENDILFHKELYYHWMHEIYHGFMTKEEIDRMIDGHDFWFNSESIKRRLEDIE